MVALFSIIPAAAGLYILLCNKYWEVKCSCWANAMPLHSMAAVRMVSCLIMIVN
jgi:hypothetical protein